MDNVSKSQAASFSTRRLGGLGLPSDGAPELSRFHKSLVYARRHRWRGMVTGADGYDACARGRFQLVTPVRARHAQRLLRPKGPMTGGGSVPDLCAFENLRPFTSRPRAHRFTKR
jgi:hypothetical protein